MLLYDAPCVRSRQRPLVATLCLVLVLGVGVFYFAILSIPGFEFVNYMLLLPVCLGKEALFSRLVNGVLGFRYLSSCVVYLSVDPPSS